MRLCRAKGWAWAEYMDNDSSASTRKPRPSHTQLLNDLRNGAIGAVAAWHLDRLYRLPGELEDLIDLVEAGRSLHGIAKEWNAQGFTSARGKAWTQTGVRAVLLNPRNAGLRAHNGEIIGEAVWPAVVALLTNPARRVGGGSGRKYLLIP